MCVCLGMNYAKKFRGNNCKLEPVTLQDHSEHRTSSSLVAKLQSLARTVPTASQLHCTVAKSRHDSGGDATLSRVDSRHRRQTAYIFGFFCAAPSVPEHTLMFMSKNICGCVIVDNGQRLDPLELGVHFPRPDGRTGRSFEALVMAKLVELRNGEHSAAAPVVEGGILP